MRLIFVISFALAVFFFPGIVSAADSPQKDDGGSFKFNFDSVPFFDEEKESAVRQEKPEDEPTEYTYDATGRKVPVRTEKSGTASPVH